ncbi:MAG: hypothetical protein JL55_18805 [Pseudomonas sp. BICA1-14]|nr:hypothetical protein [[Pseudomonas] sp. BICA1-14]KJS76220.1 MAG: hypothetical protein JL55_18805 [[Pseudomonas] sp. BICA1-14]HBW09438.1 hypothetical protein [Pseudomonas sp.]
MSTHSPAPWRYCPKTGQIVDANNRQIARVWNTSNRGRDHANGELIAAAPIWHQVFGHLGTPDEAGNAISAARDELEAALAKCVASLDQLLPYLAKVPADVGLLNEALMAARPLLDDTQLKPLNLDAPFILAYELKDNPGFEYERHAADLNDARDHLQGKSDMVVWANLFDIHGNVVADTGDLV